MDALQKTSSYDIGGVRYPQPFKTHPDLATYLGGTSPHPIERVWRAITDRMRSSLSAK